MKAFLITILFIQQICFAQNKDLDIDATPLHRAQKALTDVMVHDIFSPPVASRIYAYTNIAAYEVLVKGSKGYQSLYKQLTDFPLIPAPAKKIFLSIAAVNAFLITGKSLVFSDAILQDSATSIMKLFQSKDISQGEMEASLEYGKQVAAIILEWADKDKYKQTRSLRRYSFSKDAGKWIPTPPAYMAAVEPYWNKIRPMSLDSCTQFKPAMATAFSTDSSALFYKQAIEVYNSTKKMSQQEIAMADFWDCNPFAVSNEGHVNFAVKKISPGGHWMSIAALVCRNQNVPMMKAAAVYTLTAITIFDAFIICWDEKYRSNVIRPETYINKYIDESWRPHLQTPPFPEYPSGHSVVSAAAATILTSIFGTAVSFDDNSEVEFGLPVRHFESFTAAGKEAAISRLYGGIHYRPAIENGEQQGRDLGNWVNQKITLNIHIQ